MQAESVRALISPEEIEQTLSLERFGRYREWAGGDAAYALELYALNTRLSEALYTPMQMLEVALRNRIHAVMSDTNHERWFEDEGFLALDIQRDQLAKAVEDIQKEKKETTAGRVVAALTFSFWTSMVSSPVYEPLWQKSLHRIATGENGKGLRRKDFSKPLTPIRVLRNRIAHHEPILHWNLRKHHTNILRLTRWLSPVAAAWCEFYSRFEDVHPPGPITLHEPISR